MFRSSPPEVFSKNDALKTRSKTHRGRTTAHKRNLQQSCFATLFKSHPRMDAPSRIRNTLAEHVSPGEHLWGTAPVCQKAKKLLFTIAKRNLLTLKNK